MAIGEGERAIIFSADKDLHQLLVAGSVTQVTKVNRIDRDRMSYWTMTADKLANDTGIKPWQWVDYRTIVGDASDGIKGVEGLGPKVGRIVIEHFGTLERFYANPFACSALTKRQVALLVNAKSDVAKLQQLLRLVDDVPIAMGVV